MENQKNAITKAMQEVENLNLIFNTIEKALSENGINFTMTTQNAQSIGNASVYDINIHAASTEKYKSVNDYEKALKAISALLFAAQFNPDISKKFFVVENVNLISTDCTFSIRENWNTVYHIFFYWIPCDEITEKIAEMNGDDNNE